MSKIILSLVALAGVLVVSSASALPLLQAPDLKQEVVLVRGGHGHGHGHAHMNRGRHLGWVIGRHRGWRR